MKLSKWPLLYLIPLLSLGILLFNEWEQATKGVGFFIQKYTIILVMTTSIWLVDAHLFEKITELYPDFRNTTKRLLLTILGFVICTSVVYVLDTYLICVLLFDKSFNEHIFEHIRVTFVVTALVYVVYECLFFYSNWKKTILLTEELKKEYALAQYESLKNQINPHFLFNSLNTLSAIIPKDADKAVDFVQQLSNSYRYLLKMREKEVVRLEEELEFVQSYLFLIKSRYGDNFRISIEKDEMVTHPYLPPVSLQMLIENSIKHNIISKDKPLVVEIKINKSHVLVRNNLQVRLEPSLSTGLGLENIKKRYSLYTNEKIWIEKSDHYFSVKLPLLYLEI